MRLLIERDALAPALAAAARVAVKKGTIPILSCVLLTTQDKALAIAAHDLDSCIELRPPAEVEAPGACCVDADALETIVKGFSPGAQVRLSLAGDKLTVQAGRSRYQLPTLDALQFPPLLEPRGEIFAVLDLNATQAADLISRPVKFAAEGKDGRIMLTGVCLHRVAREDGVHVAGVGTNGYVFGAHLCPSLSTPGLPLLDEKSHPPIIPRDFVDGLLRALGDAGRIELAANIVRAVSPTSTFACKLIEEKYPLAWRLPPPIGDAPLEFDRSEILRALTRLTAVLDRQQPRVRMEWQEGEEEAVLRLDNVTSRGGGEEPIALRCPAPATGKAVFDPARFRLLCDDMRGDTLQIHPQLTSTGGALRMVDAASPTSTYALALMGEPKASGA